MPQATIPFFRMKAAELVRLKVDVIVASLTPAVQAARHATSDIPIVTCSLSIPRARRELPE